MVRNNILLLAGIAGIFGLAACAPSPLYVGGKGLRGTVGEIPRDGTGEPIWGAIRVVPPLPPPAAVPPAPGIPVTPPPR